MYVLVVKGLCFDLNYTLIEAYKTYLIQDKRNPTPVLVVKGLFTIFIENIASEF
jgi:hypothetical protein